jgi:hypothetical protein
MIDWYILLFFAFSIVILFIDSIGSHRSIYEYVAGKETSLSGGTYSLVIQYLTGATFLFPFILTEKGGLSSFFIFSLTPIFVSVLIEKLASSQDRLNRFFPFQPLSQNKVNPYFIFLFGFAALGNIMIQTSLIAILFRDLFQSPPFLGVILFLSFSFILFGLGGWIGVNKVGTLLLFAVLFSISFTVLTLYLRTGIGAIQAQFSTRFEGLFNGSSSENILYLLTFLLVMVGQTFTSFYFWESLQNVKPKHRNSSVRYSAFTWAALLLAFAVLSIYWLVQGGHTDPLKVAGEIIQATSSVSHILIFTTIAILSVGTGHALYSVISMFLYLKSNHGGRSPSHQLIKQAYLFGLMICIVIGIAAVRFSGSFSDWLPYFISFFASAGVPFIFASFQRDFSYKHFILTLGLMSIAGPLLSTFLTNFWVLAPLSALLSFVFHLIFVKTIRT